MLNPNVAALDTFEFSKKLAAVDPEEAREGFEAALDIAEAAVVPDEALIARIKAELEEAA